MNHQLLIAIEHEAMLAELSISRCARLLPECHCQWMQEARNAIYRIQALCKPSSPKPGSPKPALCNTSPSPPLEPPL